MITVNTYKGCKDYQGGIEKVYLFPFEKHSRTEITTIGEYLTIFPSTTIFETYSSTSNYSEPTEIEGGSVLYKQSLSMQVPKTLATSEIPTLVDQRYRAIYVDNIGNIRILGLYNGLDVEVTNETGSERNSLNGWKVNFSGKEDHQAYYLSDLSIFNFDFTRNLVASWQFEQNLLDYTGNNNGTAIGSIDVNDVDGGRVAFGAQFLGSTDYITVPDSTDFEMVTVGSDTPFSISLWVKFNAFRTPSEGEFLINKIGGTTNEWNIKHQDSILNATLTDGANNIRITYTPSWVIDTWYHVVITYDGSENKDGLIMYVDNVSVGTQAETGTYTGMTAGDSALIMGTDGGAPATGELVGVLDEIKVYKNRVLNVSEISKMYTKELAGISVL